MKKFFILFSLCLSMNLKSMEDPLFKQKSSSVMRLKNNVPSLVDLCALKIALDINCDRRKIYKTLPTELSEYMNFYLLSHYNIESSLMRFLKIKHIQTLDFNNDDLFGPLHTLELSPNKNCLALTIGTQLILYNIKEQIYKVINDRDALFCLTWHPIENILAFGSNGTLHIFPTVSTRKCYEFKHQFIDITWNPNGRFIAFILQDDDYVDENNCSLVLWDYYNESKVEFIKSKRKLLSLAWNYDGSLLACGGYDDGFIEIWNIYGESLKKFEAHLDMVNTLAWNKDNYLASGSQDGTLALWDQEGVCQKKFKNNDSLKIIRLAWEPDGHYFVTGAADGTISLWNISYEESLQKIKAHKKNIKGFVWNSDKCIISGSIDKEISTWKFPLNTLRKLLSKATNKDIICMIAIIKSLHDSTQSKIPLNDPRIKNLNKDLKKFFYNKRILAPFYSRAPNETKRS